MEVSEPAKEARFPQLGVGSLWARGRPSQGCASRLNGHLFIEIHFQVLFANVHVTKHIQG